MSFFTDWVGHDDEGEKSELVSLALYASCIRVQVVFG